MKLSPRLQSIADWIELGSRLADIGTDHGLLPIYCVKNGVVEYAAACDVRELPLQSARKNAASYGVENRISFFLAPGLEAVKEGTVDTVVIAGMGGETIIEILSGAEWIRNGGITLLLQPQSKITELQQWLRENGFSAEKARLVRDAGRIYLILCVRWNGAGGPEDPFYLRLLDGDELIGEYAWQLLKRTEKQLQAFRGQTEESAEKNRLTDLCALLKQIPADDGDGMKGKTDDDGK